MLVAGSFPESLARRIARFHLIDNTRGEPPMWTKGEVRELKLRDQGNGTVRLETDSGDRGYAATLAGEVQVKDGRIARFDLVARGAFWGEGRYTGGAPPGKFTLGIAFTLAGPGEASKVPPQGARDVRDYLGR